jgi:hypothetical protein
MYEPLYAVSVRHPWALAIARKYKPIENRDKKFWRGDIVGRRIALHASKEVPESCADDVEGLVGRGLWPCEPVSERAEVFATAGHILAVFTVARVIEHGDGDPMNTSPWRDKSRFAFVIANVVRLETPVFARGALGLWQVPVVTTEAVRTQLRRAEGPVLRWS